MISDLRNRGPQVHVAGVRQAGGARRYGREPQVLPPMGAPFILQLCFCWIFTRWLRSRNLASFAESIETGPTRSSSARARRGQPRLADVEDIDLRGGEPACGLEAPCIGSGTGELAREGGGRARPRQEARRSRAHSRQEATWAHRPSCGAPRVSDRRWTWLRAVTSSGLALVLFLI